MASPTANKETRKPRPSTRRSGAFEKLKRPWTASFVMRGSVYFVSPVVRGGDEYGTPVWLKPIQLNMPRR